MRNALLQIAFSDRGLHAYTAEVTSAMIMGSKIMGLRRDAVLKVAQSATRPANADSLRRPLPKVLEDCTGIVECYKSSRNRRLVIIGLIFLNCSLRSFRFGIVQSPCSRIQIFRFLFLYGFCRPPIRDTVSLNAFSCVHSFLTALGPCMAE